jgi:hypothetical protein
MDGERGGRLGSFLVGGLLGSIAGLAAAGRVRVKERGPARKTPEGLAAFEQAPCYEEVLAREAAERAGEESPSLR